MRTDGRTDEATLLTKCLQMHNIYNLIYTYIYIYTHTHTHIITNENATGGGGGARSHSAGRTFSCSCNSSRGAAHSITKPHILINTSCVVRVPAVVCSSVTRNDRKTPHHITHLSFISLAEPCLATCVRLHSVEWKDECEKLERYGGKWSWNT
jgi:hypothetical protein